MQDAAYRKRLADDLPKWLDAGWVNAGGATAILAALDREDGGRRRATFSLSAILGTLGALLLGLAVIAYVGAQWEAVPRVARLAAIALALLIAYVAAFEFDRRGHRIFAEAGVLAAGLIYAGAIALVGQAYHLSGDFAGAVMLFEAGILGAALFTGSPVLIILGLIGAGYWAWLATGQGVVPHWPSLGAVALGIVVATLQRAHYGRIIAVCALMFWMALTLLTLGHQHDWSLLGHVATFATVVLAFFGVGAMLAGFGRVPRIAALGDAVLWPSLLAVLVTLAGLQATRHPLHAGEDVWNVIVIAGAVAVVATGIATLSRLTTLLDFLAVLVLTGATMAFALFHPADDIVRNAAGGAIVIVAALWAVTLGQSGRHPIGKAFGLAAFGLEVIYIYVFTIGSRIDTALAFLVGGVLFIVLAYVLFRVDRILARRAAAAAIVADLKMEVPLPVLRPATTAVVEPETTATIAEEPETTAPPPTTPSADEGGAP